MTSAPLTPRKLVFDDDDDRVEVDTLGDPEPEPEYIEEPQPDPRNFAMRPRRFKKASQAHILMSLEPGESALWEMPEGQVVPFQRQVAATAVRLKMSGKFTSRHVWIVDPITRRLSDAVRVTRRGGQEK